MSEKFERYYFGIPVVVIVVGVTGLIVGSYYHGGPPNVSWSDVRLDILRSEITKVELDKLARAIKFDIITREEGHKWWVVGLVPEQKDVRLEDMGTYCDKLFQIGCLSRSRMYGR